MKIFWILICLGSLSGLARADSAWDRNKLVFAAKIDLDGDGRKEEIRLQNFKKKYGERWEVTPVFRLDVNGQSLFDRAGGEGIVGFGLANLNRADRWKEIFVCSPTLGDTLSLSLYRWQKGELHRVGVVDDAVFLGNGRVRCYTSPGGFSSTTYYYRLNSQGKLVEVPQRLYRLEIYRNDQKKEQWVEASKPLFLRSKPKKGKVSATFSKGTRFHILYTDLKDWYFVRSLQGTTGWLDVSQIYRGVKYLAFAG